MAVDVADWTSSVVVQSGVVSITGIATVTISGTPSVNIANTLAVTVNSGTVSIGNTPSVVISGTPTVILGGGTASIGSISAIGSTVTVAGTINIGNTPSVTISGTPSVSISGPVSISGTSVVNVTGTAAVTNTATMNAQFVTPRISTAGLTSFGIQFLAGNLVGTVTAWGSLDNGATDFYGGQFIDADGNLLGHTLTNPGNPAKQVFGIIPVAGATNVGAQVSAYTSGSTVATVTGVSPGAPSILITGTTTVSVANTPAVTISGTPTVNIGNTPAVTVSGTVTVNISSGTVSISGTPNINISSQSVTVNVNQPQTASTDLVFPAGGTSTQTTATLPAGAHALMFLNASGTDLASFQVKGHQSGIIYSPVDSSLGSFGVPLRSLHSVVVPVNSIQDTTYDVTGSTGVSAITVKVTNVLDTLAVWAQNTQSAPVFVIDLGRVNPQGSFEFFALQPPPSDSTATSAPAAGSQATVTMAGSTTQRYTADLLTMGVTSQTAASAAPAFQLLDGAGVIFQQILGTQAAVGANAHAEIPGAGLRGTLNTSMTWKANAGIANVSQAVSIGAFLR